MYRVMGSGSGFGVWIVFLQTRSEVEGLLIGNVARSMRETHYRIIPVSRSYDRTGELSSV